MLLCPFKIEHTHFQWIQRLLTKPRNSEETLIIPSHNEEASTLSGTIFCAACELAKQSRRTPNGHQKFDDDEMAIRLNNHFPRAKVSINSYVTSALCRLPTTKEKGKDKNKYTGCTIFCNHASGAIFIVSQVSLRAGETLVAKHKFKRWAQSNNMPHFQSYQANNIHSTPNNGNKTFKNVNKPPISVMLRLIIKMQWQSKVSKRSQNGLVPCFSIWNTRNSSTRKPTSQAGSTKYSICHTAYIVCALKPCFALNYYDYLDYHRFVHVGDIRCCMKEI